LLKISSTK